MIRDLETLIEQFNQLSELDCLSKCLEVDGVPVKMVDFWLKDLSPEEKAIFEDYITGVLDGVAKDLGFENAEAQFKDVGQKIFNGLQMGINTS